VGGSDYRGFERKGRWNLLAIAQAEQLVLQ
jgi:hypothetical protein